MSGKAMLDTLNSEETTEGQEEMTASVAYVQFTDKGMSGAWRGQWSRGSVFGPQSQWSWLLGQREQLQLEIDHGRRCLEQLRKEWAESNGPCEAEHARGEEGDAGDARDSGKAVEQGEGMEQFLSGWLVRLEKQLGAVTRNIEGFRVEATAEAEGPEESVLELLRAAG